MTKRVLVSLFLLCFVGFTKAILTEDDFFKQLREEINKQNKFFEDKDLISEPLTCGFQTDRLVLQCDKSSNLQVLWLSGLSLSSIPSSISQHSQSLTVINIESAGLNSLGKGFGSLNLRHLYLNANSLSTLPNELSSMAQLSSLELDRNCLTSIPHSLSSLTSLVTIHLCSNSLSTLPNDLSSLTPLQSLLLNDNPSLQASTDLFRKMKDLTELDVSNTLISGSKPELKYDPVMCNSSCVSSAECTKNESCSCSSFNFVFCSDGCSWCDLSDSCLSVDEKCSPEASQSSTTTFALILLSVLLSVFF